MFNSVITVSYSLTPVSAINPNNATFINLSSLLVISSLIELQTNVTVSSVLINQRSHLQYLGVLLLVKRFSKIRLSKFFIVLVFDLQKSNIVFYTVLHCATVLTYRDRRISYIGQYSFTALKYRRIRSPPITSVIIISSNLTRRVKQADGGGMSFDDCIDRSGEQNEACILTVSLCRLQL